jgi:5-methylcytosine-specific restriction endonuclease McrA
MYSDTYKNLRQEIREKMKCEELTKKQVIILEQQIRNDLPQICKCGRTENLTLDHIIPIDTLRQFGVLPEKEIIEGNYQLLCRTCNAFKSNKLDFSNPKTKELLIGLLEKI